MKIALLIDRPNWSYHAIANGLISQAEQSGLSFVIVTLRGRTEAEVYSAIRKCDKAFWLGWQLTAELKTKGWLFRKKKLTHLFKEINPSKTLTGIHSHRAWDDGKTTPEKNAEPPEVLVRYLSNFERVNVVSQRLHGIFKEAGLQNLWLTENGVDDERFFPAEPIEIRRGRPLRIGYSGSARKKAHDQLKGVSEFILPLGKLPGVDLVLAAPASNTQIPHEKMPELYNRIDLYVCASTSEGMSQSVLEAMACGRPILTTRVGGNENLVEEGVNGHFVNRRASDFIDKVQMFLKDKEKLAAMGLESRRRIETRWAWRHRAKDWFEFMKGTRT